jgi:AcrR family transcriptional regulator
MGLRQLNAERTRELILDAAIDLFAEQGYDESTLDDVAERAGVSISTLYRYFPSKDLLVLTPVALNGQMAEELARRPAEEPIDVALGHAVTAILGTPRGNPQRLKQVSVLVTTSAALRSRLREESVRERIALQEAIAHRVGRPQDDIYCAMTARIAMAVFELAGAHARTGEATAFGSETLAAAALKVMDALQADPPTIPRARP